MNRLKELRKNRGYTREKLSKMTGISARAIKNWEDGSVLLQNASFENVFRLAYVLQVLPHELFTKVALTIDDDSAIIELKFTE